MKPAVYAVIFCALALTPSLALAQDKAESEQLAAMRKELKLIAKAAIQYSQDSGKFPCFEENEQKAFQKGLELLITKKYLKREDLKEARKARAMAGFFLKLKKNPKSPRLICAAQSRPDKKMIMALTDGSFVTVDLTDRAKVKEQIEKYLTPEYMDKGTRQMNEVRTIGALRSLQSAQAIYREKSQPQSYGSLKDLVQSKLIDSVLGSGEKNGYRFTCHVGDKDGQNKAFQYHILATPTKPGKTGRRHFYVDQSGRIRCELDKAATANSPDLYEYNKRKQKPSKAKTEGQDGGVLINETVAIGTLKTLNSAQAIYRERNKAQVYGTLEQLIAAKLISADLKSGKKSGYIFKVKPGDKNGKNLEYLYTITAHPIEPGKTGKRYFFTDMGGVIRYSTSGPADGGSKAIRR